MKNSFFIFIFILLTACGGNPSAVEGKVTPLPTLTIVEWVDTAVEYYIPLPEGTETILVNGEYAVKIKVVSAKDMQVELSLVVPEGEAGPWIEETHPKDTRIYSKQDFEFRVVIRKLADGRLVGWLYG